MAQYRSWRFIHPDFERGEDSIGLCTTPSGGIAMVEDQASIRQAILLLLSTAPGERVMRPDYGCDLNRLVYSTNDDTTAGLAIHYVRQALTQWEPRIEILNVDAKQNDLEPTRLDIILDYRVRSTLRNERLLLPLNLSEVTF